MNTEIHEKYMRRCLELAASAAGLTAPNPMVGALLVYNGKIIAEGKHAYYGAPHAEPDAISKVTDVDVLKNSTLYVSLEPCCHYGKTPPCTEKIISCGIPNVVVATLDTSFKVNGKGIKILNDAGITTIVGVLEKEARELNKFFFTYQEKKRPYILLKWAQTMDGFIDSDRNSIEIPPAKISNNLSLIASHKLRTQYQSIMVGTNTVVKDNPSLTARHWDGKNPLRITVDRNARLHSGYNIFNSQADTLVFSTKQDINYGSTTKVITTNYDNLDNNFIINSLYDLKIQSIIVEGGAELINRFIDLDLWDEAIVFKGNLYFNNGVKAPVLHKKPISEDVLGSDIILTYKNQC